MTKTGEVWGKKFYSRIYTKPAGEGGRPMVLGSAFDVLFRPVRGTPFSAADCAVHRIAVDSTSVRRRTRSKGNLVAM